MDFALPPRCPGCGVITEGPHRFCLTCWQSLTFLGEPCCERCSLPFEYDSGEGAECGACLAEPPFFDTLRTAVAYGDVARKVALKLKYSGRPAVAETVGHFMQRHLANEDPVAILAPSRCTGGGYGRGYNRSALIAHALARRSGLRLELDLIRRVKATPPLKGIGRRERALTVRGAFAIKESANGVIKRRNILLVDDVYTTGATANA